MDNFFFGKNKFSKSESNQEFTEISSNYSRTYSKGKSFKFSIWNEVDTYNNDEFVQDFVQWNQKLWAAKKTSTNIPPTQGEYWELIVEGVSDVEFKQEDNRILWKYEDDLEWKDLFELDSVSEEQIKKMLEDLDIKYRNTYDVKLSETSTNAVQNQAVTKKFKELDEKNTRTDNELTNIKSSVNTALSNSKSYTDSKISETKIQIDSELNKKANQTNIDETVDELNKSINLKVDKVFGKGLSTNDFNDNYKSKLDNLDSSLNSTLTSAKSHTNSEITKVDNKIKSEISRAQASETNLSNRIDGLKEDLTNALNEAKEYTDSEVKNNTNKLNILNGTGEGSVIKTVKDEIAKVVDGAPEQFNTLKEISEYLNSHEDVASGLVESITKLETEKLSVSDIDSALSTESENPVMNKVITAEFESVRTELDSQNELIEDLQNTKIDKEADDYYPQLAVGLADNLSGVDVVDSEINFRRSGGGAISDGVARIEAIKGNSVVWNQVINADDYRANNSTITRDSDGWYNIMVSAQYGSIIFNISNLITNHQYLFSYEIVKDSFDMSVYFDDGFYPHVVATSNALNGVYTKIVTYTEEGSSRFRFQDNRASGWTSWKLRNVQIIDLTQMFGAGNEPTTIEEFYARKPIVEDEYAYNEGEVIHMDVQSIESQGVNAWDEEWEVGTYNLTTGEKSAANGYIRSANLCKCLPNEKYYIKTTKALYILWYDNNQNYISNIWASNGIIQAPSNAAYLAFRSVNSGELTTYKNDICINLSDTSINGKYFPYIKRVEDLSIIRKYFPNGMKSAGSAHDEIRYNKASGKWEKVVRIGEVDMGTLNWAYTSGDISKFSSLMPSDARIFPNNVLPNLMTRLYAAQINDTNKLGDKNIYRANAYVGILDSSYTDAASFKAAMAGVILYYELAEPIVTELDEADQFKDLDYQVWNAGTEKANAEGKSAPLAADITYGFNAIGKIKELESLVAALRAKVGI